jgi:hypothetical protein
VVTSHYIANPPPNEDAYERHSISNAITANLKRDSRASIAGGDFNALSNTIAVKLFENSMWDTYARFPGAQRNNSQRIDYIFYRGKYKVINYDTSIDGNPSDHPIVIATLKSDLLAQPFPPSTAPDQGCVDVCVEADQTCMEFASTPPARRLCGLDYNRCVADCPRE